MLERFRNWIQTSHGFNTPQGITLLIGTAICWGVAGFRFSGPDVAAFRALASPAWLYVLAPFLGLLAFVRHGMTSHRPSWLAMLSVIAMRTIPFLAPFAHR